MTLIDARTVDDAVLARLNAAVSPPGRLYIAPTGDPSLYFVVERPPGSQRTGSLGLPEQGLAYRLRLRAVARHANPEEAGRAALDLLTKLAGALLDRAVPVSGEGWAVSGRAALADGGVDVQGQLANATADAELLIYPA